MKDEDEEIETRIISLGPLLALADRELTEEMFWTYVDLAGIPHFDPVVYHRLREYVNICHYAGIITITDRYMTESILDDMSHEAFEAVLDSDDHLKSVVKNVEDGVAWFSEILA